MVHIHTDFGVFSVEHTASQTVAQMIQSLFDQQDMESRGGWQVQETMTGSVLDVNSETVDTRYYYLTGFIVRRAHRTP